MLFPVGVLLFPYAQLQVKLAETFDADAVSLHEVFSNLVADKDVLRVYHRHV